MLPQCHIIMIDKGKILYDGEARKFHQRFSAYRTLKVQLDTPFQLNGKLTDIINSRLLTATPIIAKDMVDQWIDISFNEDEISMMDVLRCVLEITKAVDIKIEEVKMEDLIRKSYQGQGGAF